MKIFASRADRHRALIALGFGLLAVVLALVIGRQYLAFMFDVGAFQEWLGQFGVLTPVAFILVQVRQVVFAPDSGTRHRSRCGMLCRTGRRHNIQSDWTGDRECHRLHDRAMVWPSGR